ncbi:MAG: LysM peptidoglycan-binding domain-containing protein [Calditrichaeota bacterium]|nr:LysM peptidoglycan-binding domain-containing protein [Calditrichota bacterium]MCB9088577.1 LysM peptidoglycan-binding domain-containing protein [Calditrichia bacterium]MCB0288629.1 LysM peptidoglycan-binding domain-containing protein [Calditrichota bacterium]MCB0294142.1 LysM peptidoglycan-binding domain-containing protein [Calditrichota bacterium]MCB0302447.1 LysM peptidoglycan-binding domain-containing protein [Calditrichota bacterium]
MGLQKLTIKPLNAKLKETGKEIKAMYNPNELTIETRNQFQRTAMPGLPTPVTQYVSGQTQTISVSLFFDTYEKGEDVRKYTAEVAKLLKIDKAIHAPPVCLFEWGGSIAGDKATFKGVLDSVSQRFTMFLDSGIPVRATLTVSISEYKNIKEQLKEIGFESADHTKRRTFKEGDSLWMIAYDEYGDPANWRDIAQTNKIVQPRLVEPGTELEIPPLE